MKKIYKTECFGTVLFRERGKKVQYCDKAAVGSRIKKLRKSRNLTQSKLSEYLDYTNERQLQRIENGENSLRSECDGELNQASYNAMIEVYNKANNIENKIKMYWNSSSLIKIFLFI